MSEAHNQAKRIGEIAIDLVTGDRATQYGDPITMWNKVADVWSAFLGRTITRTEALCMMQQLKQVREQMNSHEDNRIDSIGYALLIAGCEHAEMLAQQPVLPGPRLCAECGDEVNMHASHVVDKDGNVYHNGCAK